MAKPRHKPMDDKALKAAIHSQVTIASEFLDGQPAADRRKAMDRYLGKPLGNEIDGQSQVVSSDAQDVIESVMPDLMQIFTATEQLARFEPTGEEDEEYADQATDYINYVFHRDNEGSLILHDWFKDALLQSNGVVKVYWDERVQRTVESYSGLTGDEATKLEKEDGVSVTEQETRIIDDVGKLIEQVGLDVDVDDLPNDPDDLLEMLVGIGVEPGPAQALVDNGVVYDLTIVRKKEIKRALVENIPPEEFLISPRARNLDDSPLTGHRALKTISELIEMGYDDEVLNAIPEGDSLDFNQAQAERSNRASLSFTSGDAPDSTMREITVHELYMRIDYDGDGVAELRKIVTAGPAHEILENEEAAEHPFEALTPIRMPHRWLGRSLAEMVEDIVLIKTTLWRQLLNNAYNINNARAAISNKVSLEDYLSNRVGSPVRVNTDGPVGEHIRELQTVSIGRDLYPLLEYTDTTRETRTGVNRLGQGIDPNALNSTARGMNMLLGRSQQRILLMAQIMAQMGVKRLAKKLLRIMIRHQDKPRVIRLRNEWVEMDPRSWNSDMDVEVQVGLGHGTQEAHQAALMLMAQFQEKVVTLQGGPGVLVGWKQIANLGDKMAEVIGLKTSAPYIKEITEDEIKQIEEQQAQRPNPEAEKAKAEMAQAQQDAQIKMQSDKAKFESDMALKRVDQAIKDEDLAIKKIERAIKQDDLMIRQAAAGLDAAAKRDTAQLHREKVAIDMAATQWKSGD